MAKVKKVAKARTGQDLMLHSLILNAVDFLKRSTDELTNYPKYSVIHFCVGVELFLKARLMMDHWSLVIDEQKKASLASFAPDKDFYTVGMKELLRRLRDLAGEDLQADAEIFQKLADHRNQLVHFFHAKYASKNADQIQEIAAEQCVAWFRLHKLLTEQWEKRFEEYRRHIARIDSAMHQHKPFLKAKFDQLKPEIAVDKKKGIGYDACDTCGFKARREVEQIGAYVSRECRVCESAKEHIRVTCTACEEVFRSYGGHARCYHCEHGMPMSVIKRQLYQGSKDKLQAWCYICEFDRQPTVVRLAVGGDKQYVCVNCIHLSSVAEPCTRCGRLTNTYSEDDGCFKCSPAQSDG